LTDAELLKFCGLPEPASCFIFDHLLDAHSSTKLFVNLWTYGWMSTVLHLLRQPWSYRAAGWLNAHRLRPDEQLLTNTDHLRNTRRFRKAINLSSAGITFEGVQYIQERLDLVMLGCDAWCVELDASFTPSVG